MLLPPLLVALGMPRWGLGLFRLLCTACLKVRARLLLPPPHCAAASHHAVPQTCSSTSPPPAPPPSTCWTACCHSTLVRAGGREWVDSAGWVGGWGAWRPPAAWLGHPKAEPAPPAALPCSQAPHCGAGPGPPLARRPA